MPAAFLWMLLGIAALAIISAGIWWSYRERRLWYRRLTEQREERRRDFWEHL